MRDVPVAGAAPATLGGKRVDWAGQIPLATLVVLCVVISLLTDRFLTTLNVTNVLVQAAVIDRKSTRLNSSHRALARMPSSA